MARRKDDKKGKDQEETASSSDSTEGTEVSSTPPKSRRTRRRHRWRSLEGTWGTGGVADMGMMPYPFLSWQPGPSTAPASGLPELMQGLHVSQHPAAGPQHHTTSWLPAPQPSSYPAHPQYMQQTVPPGFPDAQTADGYTVLVPTASPAGNAQIPHISSLRGPTHPPTHPAYAPCPVQPEAPPSLHSVPIPAAYASFPVQQEAPPSVHSVHSVPLSAAPSVDHVACVSPAATPQLPATLSYNPALWEPLTYRAQPGNEGAQGTMLYDSTTGLVLEVRQGNAGLLQRLAAAGHQLQPAGAACCQRVAELQDVLNGPVMAQRGKILEQQARLSLRAGEIRSAAKAIAQRTRAIMQDILDRLTTAEADKLREVACAQAALSTELHRLDQHVSRVWDTCHTRHDGPDAFLSVTSALLQDSQRLANKAVPTTLPAHPDQLPTEAQSLSDLTRTNTALTKLLRVKDAMIWQLLKDRDQMAEKSNALAHELAAEVEALERRCAELESGVKVAKDTTAPRDCDSHDLSCDDSSVTTTAPSV